MYPAAEQSRDGHLETNERRSIGIGSAPEAKAHGEVS